MSTLSINSSFPAQRSYSAATNLYNSSLLKLSTASRINRAADDPAGLISSEQLSAALASLEAESSGMDRADAIANTADGALSEVSSLLSDANAAAVAAANTAGLSPAERDAYQMEIDSALQAADRIAHTTTFNGQRLLDGTMTLTAGGASQPISSTALTDLGQTAINGTSYRLSDAMSGGPLDSRTNPAGAQQSIAAAISQVATIRGQIGAFQKDQIEPARRASAAQFENTAAAYSQIHDTDYATESANLSRAQTLQASAAMLLDISNTNPRRVLSMLNPR